MKEELGLVLEASWNPGTPPTPQSHHFPPPTPTEPAGPKVSASQRAARAAASIVPMGPTALSSSRSERQWTHPHDRYWGRHARISTRPFLRQDNDTHFFPDLCPPGGAAGLDRCRQTASNYPPPQRGHSSLLPITIAKSHPLSALGISKGALTELLPPPAATAVASEDVCTRMNTREVTNDLVTCTETLGELLVAVTQRRGAEGRSPPSSGARAHHLSWVSLH